jgi:hypothetical protein
VRTILDHTHEMNPDRAAAHVAIFSTLGFSELRDSRVMPEFALEDGHIEGRQKVAETLAALPKPLWLYGAVSQGRLIVQVGDLNERPDLRRRYDLWHKDRSGRPRPYAHATPMDGATVLCCTDAHGLRVHWRDFAKYERDYFPAGTFSYGMSDVVSGKSPALRRFERAELEGISWTIGISNGGSGVLFLERPE